MNRFNRMKYGFRLTIAMLLLGVGVREALAELRVAGIFADHMVLQRERPIEVWGWSEAGAKVTVTLIDQAETTDVREDGTWSVTLQPMKANSEAMPLRIASSDQSIVINDILVGEVWHASGQSNMEMTVGAMATELKSVAMDRAAADLPQLRFCRIDAPESSRPLEDLRQSATWNVCDPMTVSGFSGRILFRASAPCGIKHPHRRD